MTSRKPGYDWAILSLDLLEHNGQTEKAWTEEQYETVEKARPLLQCDPQTEPSSTSG